MKILVKYPSRNRKEKFYQNLNKMRVMANNSNDITYHFTIDDDEVDLYFIETLGGKSNNKIHAVNRDVPESDWDILVVMSDDMVCITHGWDDIIRQDMNENFPDTDGVLHYNDGNQKANVMTMSIIGRKYYQRDGYIYNPEYQSLWCDVEATEVAHMRGKYKYMGDATILFAHHHPAWGFCLHDEQYRKTESPYYWQKDRQVIENNRAKNYGLKENEIINQFKYQQL
jgi:hypothetical protein